MRRNADNISNIENVWWSHSRRSSCAAFFSGHEQLFHVVACADMLFCDRGLLRPTAFNRNYLLAFWMRCSDALFSHHEHRCTSLRGTNILHPVALSVYSSSTSHYTLLRLSIDQGPCLPDPPLGCCETSSVFCVLNKRVQDARLLPLWTPPTRLKLRQFG